MSGKRGPYKKLIGPRVSTRVRFLEPGEMPPEGVEPKRYVNASGYVRLRWRVSRYELVECFEHRWVMQCFDPEKQVHHINHDRSDNRPENLEIVTTAEHGRHHRKIDRDLVVALYAEGLSVPAVAREVGHDHGAIYRVLVAEGIEIRPGATYHIADLDLDVVRRLHESGVRARRIATLLGVSPTCIDGAVERLGLTPHREGRPTNAELAAQQRTIEEVCGAR